jgi:hypothetical protein
MSKFILSFTPKKELQKNNNNNNILKNNHNIINKNNNNSIENIAKILKKSILTPNSHSPHKKRNSLITDFTEINSQLLFLEKRNSARVLSNFSEKIKNNLKKNSNEILKFKKSISSELFLFYLDSSNQKKKNLFLNEAKRIASLRKNNINNNNNNNKLSNNKANKKIIIKNISKGKYRERVINNFLYQRDLLMSSLHATKDPQSILIVNKRISKLNTKIQDLLNEDSKKLLREEIGFSDSSEEKKNEDLESSSSRLNIFQYTENDNDNIKNNKNNNRNLKPKNRYKYISSLNDQFLTQKDILEMNQENLEIYKRNKKEDLINKLENQIKLNQLSNMINENQYLNPNDAKKDLIFVRDIDTRINLYEPCLNHKTTYDSLNKKSIKNIGFKKGTKIKSDLLSIHESENYKDKFHNAHKDLKIFSTKKILNFLNINQNENINLKIKPNNKAINNNNNNDIEDDILYSLKEIDIDNIHNLNNLDKIKNNNNNNLNFIEKRSILNINKNKNKNKKIKNNQITQNNNKIPNDKNEKNNKKIVNDLIFTKLAYKEDEENELNKYDNINININNIISSDDSYNLTKKENININNNINNHIDLKNLFNYGKSGIKNLLIKKEEREKKISIEKKIKKEKNLFVESKKKEFFNKENDNKNIKKIIEIENVLKNIIDINANKSNKKNKDKDKNNNLDNDKDNYNDNINDNSNEKSKNKNKSRNKSKNKNSISYKNSNNNNNKKRSGVLLALDDSFEDKTKIKESNFRNKLTIFRKIFGVAYKESKRLDVN